MAVSGMTKGTYRPRDVTLVQPIAVPTDPQQIIPSQGGVTAPNPSLGKATGKVGTEGGGLLSDWNIKWRDKFLTIWQNRGGSFDEFAKWWDMERVTHPDSNDIYWRDRLKEIEEGGQFPIWQGYIGRNAGETQGGIVTWYDLLGKEHFSNPATDPSAKEGFIYEGKKYNNPDEWVQLFLDPQILGGVVPIILPGTTPIGPPTVPEGPVPGTGGGNLPGGHEGGEIITPPGGTHGGGGDEVGGGDSNWVNTLSQYVARQLDPERYQISGKYIQHLEPFAREGYGQQWMRSMYEGALAPATEQYVQTIGGLRDIASRSGFGEAGVVESAMERARAGLGSQALSTLGSVREQNEAQRISAQGALNQAELYNKTVEEAIADWNRRQRLAEDVFKMGKEQAEAQRKVYEALGKKSELGADVGASLQLALAGYAALGPWGLLAAGLPWLDNLFGG